MRNIIRDIGGGPKLKKIEHFQFSKEDEYKKIMQDRNLWVDGGSHAT